MVRPIRPLLVGPEGISKKISVPFLEPLKANQAFGVLLKCTLPRCLTARKRLLHLDAFLCAGSCAGAARSG